MVYYKLYLTYTLVHFLDTSVPHAVLICSYAGYVRRRWQINVKKL